MRLIKHITITTARWGDEQSNSSTKWQLLLFTLTWILKINTTKLPNSTSWDSQEHRIWQNNDKVTVEADRSEAINITTP